MNDYVAQGFYDEIEKQAKSFQDTVVDANLRSEGRAGRNRTVRRAERELVKNQTKKIKTYTPAGAAIGAGVGALLGKRSRGLGAAIGGLAGTLGGFTTGAVAGSRGSDAAKIRKKHFGTSDLGKIRAKYFKRNSRMKKRRS